MPLKEERIFIKDPQPELSVEEKIAHLSAKLALAPLNRLKIVRIERIEIGGSGWWILHRTGSP